MFEPVDVDVVVEDVSVAEAEGTVDEIDDEIGQLGEVGDGFVAGSAVGVAVGGSGGSAWHASYRPYGALR